MTDCILSRSEVLEITESLMRVATRIAVGSANGNDVDTLCEVCNQVKFKTLES